MQCRSLLGAFALAVLLVSAAGGQTARGAKYPDLKGQWNRAVCPGVPASLRSTRPRPGGPEQDAPLTPEYQNIFEAQLGGLAGGGHGKISSGRCAVRHAADDDRVPCRWNSWSRPRRTYVLIGDHETTRRIYTDGRDWPKEIEPTYGGYSIGNWVDADGGGRYDLLEVETRGFKGPRVTTPPACRSPRQPVDHQGAHLSRQGRSEHVHDEITVIDHALTRPWTVDKTYVRDPDPWPQWPESDLRRV